MERKECVCVCGRAKENVVYDDAVVFAFCYLSVFVHFIT